MFTNSLAISSKGQITLPKKIRDLLSTRTIKFEITEDNKVILLPVKDVAGSLTKYTQEKSQPFELVREQAWEKSLSKKSNDE